jgi:hypothetical protein
VPELVSRLSLVLHQRFYNNEDRIVRIKMLEEIKAQDVLGVWTSWRQHRRFPPVLSQPSPNTSLTPSVASDEKKRNQSPIKRKHR